MNDKGKLTATDGGTFEYDFTRVPRVIVVSDEAGEEKWWVTFHYAAGIEELAPYVEAFRRLKPLKAVKRSMLRRAG